jgi:hypothetical protein
MFAVLSIFVSGRIKPTLPATANYYSKKIAAQADGGQDERLLCFYGNQLAVCAEMYLDMVIKLHTLVQKSK